MVDIIRIKLIQMTYNGQSLLNPFFSPAFFRNRFEYCKSESVPIRQHNAISFGNNTAVDFNGGFFFKLNTKQLFNTPKLFISQEDRSHAF